MGEVDGARPVVVIQLGREAGGGEVGGEARIGGVERREGEAVVITPEQRRRGDAQREARVETVVQAERPRGAVQAQALAVEQRDDRLDGAEQHSAAAAAEQLGAAQLAGRA